jgi:hypothetical protein
LLNERCLIKCFRLPFISSKMVRSKVVRSNVFRAKVRALVLVSELNNLRAQSFLKRSR